MEKIATEFPEVWIIKPKVFEDSRSFFYESYSKDRLAAIGLNYDFIQDSHSKSEKNTIRGLHFRSYLEKHEKY